MQRPQGEQKGLLGAHGDHDVFRRGVDALVGAECLGHEVVDEALGGPVLVEHALGAGGVEAAVGAQMGEEAFGQGARVKALDEVGVGGTGCEGDGVGVTGHHLVEEADGTERRVLEAGVQVGLVQVGGAGHVRLPRAARRRSRSCQRRSTLSRTSGA